ncbi:uncharacterized protein LOC120651352 isoform X2 [Panicum virgatum]|uniref:uncharacterized protein LOC120651352 isoform X2 n=1 Tax=Panicum virgatum TaxID=38727 RepID=UPI0019D54DC7|nr:uncharacterized protein LOC120651352 isoform X2 [Panicum virgatum]
METNCSRTPLGDLTNHNDGGAERERERARYAAMSQSEKNARNLRQREARQKTKEHHNLMEIVDSRAPFGDLTNQSNGGAHPIHSQQPMIVSIESRKGIEQGMQQCLEKRRMREI